MEQMYSLKTAAQLLDVSVKTVRRLIHQFNIPTYTVGSRIRVKQSDLDKLITKNLSIMDIHLPV
ncbi:MAG: helix-turn-helix domain-containing protein [Candidatus Marinimicrobia bacterium]|jgi:excisionase family DNA binding protein|nr:helix-turn-helix domain-containing protein [Candidatus Neomarinimicrobiota bacterium]MBT3575318.1 helix-turn-helix domain-containing protein [Candidatus Neomarinimicrobiota bacterium]MBT3681255.1 helix-turn-helix domain-containing protein [Candidatus Neomarinimicrobiota bacterium]MBT3952222.1 helix-turn-helix domain-containing protein [Candidatus Neomarinimicrobiota bacterium]MBT4253357.1 helix-turn-helix domain-containing protein [Candidatus Neomarinimicrobiota bacterium]